LFLVWQQLAWSFYFNLIFQFWICLQYSSCSSPLWNSQPDTILSTTNVSKTSINLAIYVFFMDIIWFAKWAWAKLYKTVHSTVHMLSCLYCTVQLTDTDMASVLSTNLRGDSRWPAHILLLDWGPCKSTEMVQLHDNVAPWPWPPPMSSCFLRFVGKRRK
jgi:hypothetical protein